MTSPKPIVLFSHGHLSSPDSLKIQQLAPIAGQAGFQTHALDYRDLRDDPAGRAQRLLEHMQALDQAPVLVGSSLGGWVSMYAAEHLPAAGLFLMAPALFMEDRVPGGVVPETYRPRSPQISVVHGWHDDIIPWQSSLRWASQQQASLHLVDSDHRLESAMETLKALFSTFLAHMSQAVPAAP